MDNVMHINKINSHSCSICTDENSFISVHCHIMTDFFLHFITRFTVKLFQNIYRYDQILSKTLIRSLKHPQYFRKKWYVFWFFFFSFLSVSISQQNTFSNLSLFGIHNVDIFIFSRSGESHMTFELERKHNNFIILLLWLGPDVAVKAVIDALGHRDLSSPIFENHSLNGSVVLSLSPLQYKCTCT